MIQDCFHDLLCMMSSLYKIEGIIVLLDLTIIIYSIKINEKIVILKTKF